MIGARVIKTCIAITLSVLIARLFPLENPQFAGIIAVLAVQPSIYLTVRHGLQQVVSAVVGATFGALALYTVGNSFLVIGCVTLILMSLHVKLRWTNTLLVSVVICINTMGTKTLSSGDSAFNQIILVVIGIGVATLINMLYEPIHEERAEILLIQSERMLRSLLHFMLIEWQAQRIVPYPEMKQQINQIRKFIEQGRDIAAIARQDNTFRNLSNTRSLSIFHSYESMVERIRDMSKEMQKINASHPEADFAKKAIRLVIRIEERLMENKSIHSSLLCHTLAARQKTIFDGLVSDNFENMLAYYNFYSSLQQYICSMQSLHENG